MKRETITIEEVRDKRVAHSTLVIDPLLTALSKNRVIEIRLGEEYIELPLMYLEEALRQLDEKFKEPVE